MGAPHLGRQTLFFLKKKLATFLVITVCQFCSVTPIYFLLTKLATFFGDHHSLLFILLVHSGVAHYFRHAKKLPLLLWGALFCWGPCSAKNAEHA